MGYQDGWTLEQAKAKYSDLLQSHHSLCGEIELRRAQGEQMEKDLHNARLQTDEKRRALKECEDENSKFMKQIAVLKLALEGFVDEECHCKNEGVEVPCVQCVARAALSGRRLKRTEEPECDCMIPALEGAGQHSPSCAIFKKRKCGHCGSESKNVTCSACIGARS